MNNRLTLTTMKRSLGLFTRSKTFGTNFYSTTPTSAAAASTVGTTTTTIHGKLKQDLKTAMKAKDKQKLNVIKGILSDLTYAEKSQLLPPSNTAAAAAAGSVGSTPPSFSKDNDSDVATIIQKSIKKRQESIESFQNNGRPELADAEKQEVEILSSYLPKQLSDGEIEAIALVTVKRLLEAKKISGGIKSMGVVMKELDIDTARAPKSRVAGIVKKLLSSSMS